MGIEFTLYNSSEMKDSAQLIVGIGFVPLWKISIHGVIYIVSFHLSLLDVGGKVR